MLAAGTQLGPYNILSRLGAGGMGEVYLSEDTRLKRKIALKLLPPEFTQDADRVRRFKQEAIAASALNHPNIITIHEIGEAGGTHYLATEFIDGQTLRQQMTSERLKLSAALEVVIQTASALSAAHEAGIIHRDIKPENVMLRRDAYVKVLDFGLAKLTEPSSPATDTQASTATRASTETGAVMGTVRYMSPEQARGFKVDARTDIFSLGVLLYEMIAGRRPFEGNTTTDVLVSILEREPPPLSPHGIPAELQRIVGKALRKDREERYQVVKDLLLDLKSLKEELIYEAKSLAARELETSDAAMDTTSLDQGLETAEVTDARSTEAIPGRTPSIWVSKIKLHKLGVIIALAILVITSAAAIYFFFVQSRKSIESLAVLPFANVGADPNTEYLADGIPESIINSLSQLPKLKVMSRNSAFRFKGREAEVQEVGRKLGVGAVLTGRVAQRGDGLSISVELINAQDNSQIWGEQYNRKLADALAVQQEISREISERLRMKLSGEEQRKLTRRDTSNPEAYQFYLKGRFYWNKRTADNLRKAMEQFQQAVDKDPTYALAYVGLADSYIVLEEYSGTPGSETIPKAKAFAQHALQLDDSLAEPHATLAFAYSQLWQWEESQEEFKRALKLNPNYPTAHHWYSIHLNVTGRFDEALTEVKRAHELDPLSLVIAIHLVAQYLNRGDLSSSIEESKRIIDLDQNFPRGHELLGLAYLNQGRYSEAIAELQKAVDLSFRRDRRPLRTLGYGYAVSGKRAEALAILKELQEKYEKDEASPIDVAAVYAGLGEKDQAFTWLERGFQNHSSRLGRIRWEPGFEPLRSDPRFADLLRRMGLRP